MGSKEPIITVRYKSRHEYCDLVALANSLERVGWSESIYRDNPFIRVGMHPCRRR